MYDMNEWRPKVQKALLKFIIILKSSWAKRGGGGADFRGGHSKDIKVLSTCNFNQRIRAIRAVIIAEE